MPPQEKKSIVDAVTLMQRASDRLLKAQTTWATELMLWVLEHGQDYDLTELVEPLKRAYEDSKSELKRAVELDPPSPWIERLGELILIARLPTESVIEPWKQAQKKSGTAAITRLAKQWKGGNPLKLALVSLKHWQEILHALIQQHPHLFGPGGPPEGGTPPPSPPSGGSPNGGAPPAPVSPSGAQSGPEAEPRLPPPPVSASTAEPQPHAGSPAQERPSQDAQQQAKALWQQAGIKPSDVLERALEEVCQRSRQSIAVITPWHMLLGLLEDGAHAEAGVSSASEAGSSALPTLLLQKLRQLQLSLPALWEQSIPAKPPVAAAPSLSLSSGLTDVLRHAQRIQKRCSSGDEVAVRHLVAAMIGHFAKAKYAKELHSLSLADLSECLAQHLPVHQDKDHLEEWSLVLAEIDPTSPPGAKGTESTAHQREAATHELCLNIHGYASAIQDVLVKAEPGHDFVLGLFGPWGRGKTTLMRETAKLIQDSHESLVFNAAKYPSRPEVWVHLYEAVARAATAGSFWARWRLRIRIGLLRTGWWPLFLGLTMAAFSFFTRAYWAAEIIGIFLSAFGVLGLTILAGFVYRVFSQGRQLISLHYADIPDHSDKLGLQAVIGDDLERLLRAWFPSRASIHTTPRLISPGQDPRPGFWKRSWQSLMHYLSDPDCVVDFRPFRYGWWALALCLAILSCGAWFTIDTAIKLSAWKLSHSGLTAWVWLSTPAAATPAAAPWTWVHWAILALLILLALWVALKIGSGPADAKRVLLIVDDLDRCEPDQALSVIESIRWFLDNPNVNSRLHVAILMERESLEAACKKRAKAYGQLHEKRTRTRNQPDADDNTAIPWKQRFRALREKLFMVELTLPNLTFEDVNALIALILRDGSSGSADAATTLIAAPLGKGTTTQLTPPAHARSTAPLTRHPQRPAHGQQKPAQPKDVEKSTCLTEDERRELASILKQAQESGHIPPGLLTPRSVRAIIFRYLFARQLLHSLDFRSGDLMLRLVNAMFDTDLPLKDNELFSSELDAIVTQLT